MQIAPGMGQADAFIYRLCFFQHLGLVGQHLEGLNDVQPANSGAQGAREVDAYENRALREDGAVRGQKQVFEQGILWLTPCVSGKWSELQTLSVEPFVRHLGRPLGV